jgi:hypothetical protein
MMCRGDTTQCYNMDLPIPIIDLEAAPSENATKIKDACVDNGFFFGERQ